MSKVYDGIVISRIKVVDMGNGIVEFGNNSPAGEKARFLKDVTKTGSADTFTATEIDYSEAKRVINLNGAIGADTTPLFCVHGFNFQPSDVLEDIEEVRERFEKGGHYYPVPIMWPCSDGNALLNYDKDQEGFSQDSGALFEKLVEQIPDDTFPRKSLLIHSMGNHVVFNGSCGAESAPQVQFENIFMVAADIPFDVFHKDPNDNYRSKNAKYLGNKKHKATNFFQMLARNADGKPKGKICFLHNLKDDALFWSSKQNWENRVGQRGIGIYKPRMMARWKENKDLVRDEIRDHYENYDVEGFIDRMEDKKHKHSYQFEDFAIEYYNMKSKEIQL